MLRHIDIEPVFFWDGPRGSGKEYEMKLSTWEKRTKDSLEVIFSHSRITKYDPTAELRFGKRIMQPLLVTELVMALQEAKVELITCKGEADNLMAEYMRVHGNVCGILTNDTDMMLMHGVTAIHYKLFDQEDALKLSDDHIPANYKVAEVHCGAISPGYLARRLKINEECLPALSILCGNDFTKDLNEEMDIKNSVFGYINYDYVRTYEYIKTVLKWIKDNEDACMGPVSFLAIREIADVCKKEPRYIAAVRHSYAFYTRSHPAAVAAIMPASSNSFSSESEDSEEEEYDDTTTIPFHINDNTTESGPVTAHSSNNEGSDDDDDNDDDNDDDGDNDDDDDIVVAKPDSIDKTASSIDDEAGEADSFLHQSDSDSTVSSDDNDSLCSFITREVSSLGLDRKCLPVVKSGILWRDEIEQLDDELRCIYDVLQPVRMIIYKLLCCKNITEFGQSKINEFVEIRLRVPNPCMLEDLKTLRRKTSCEQKVSLFVKVFKLKKLDHIHLLQPLILQPDNIPPVNRVPDIGSLLACVCFI
uniref:XPG-I domain-containing protein n=1 Tax=Amphimedon queenslandica TaxID=400682 RepID=A0A1X7SS26_AMPQE